jgi:hypothetical protein
MIRTLKVATFALSLLPALSLASEESYQAGYRAGYAHGQFMGQFLPYVVMAAVVAGAWLGWRIWKRRRNRKRGDV